MIEINLLPLEMRKVDRSSLKRLVAAVAAVVLFSSSAVAVALSVKAYRAESERKSAATAEVARVEPVAREYDALESEIKGIGTRIQTIEEVRATRMRWGRKLDQLYALLPEYVWFEKMDLKNVKGTGGQVAPTATLVMECFLAGADEKRYAEFRRVLTGEVVADGPYTGREFFGDFAALGGAGWEREEFRDTEEGVALKFALELPVKSTAPAPAKSTPVVRPSVAAK
jgi:hypothetical protein